MNSNYKKPVGIEIPEEVKEEAKEYAKGLDENRHFERRVGEFDDLYRSCIGQIMVHKYLESKGIEHEYMKPYHSEGRPANEFDIKIEDLGEFDVKCRGRWKDDYFYNIPIIISEHEKEERLKTDYYIFCTTDKELKNFYILGALSYQDLWKKLKPAPEWNYKFPPAGVIYSRDMHDLIKTILRV